MSNYTSGLTVITCTGDRPEAFALCAKYVARQTWSGPLQWIVVNDGSDEDVLEAVDVPDRILVAQLIPSPPWRPGQNTLARNILAALPKVKYDKVLFIEDDDWYAEDYCTRMSALLDGASGIVGDPTSVYYNVRSQSFRIMRNVGCASLCQTGLRSEYLTALRNTCQESADFIDARLWRRVPSRLLLHVGGVVGIKGLSGRPGIGTGHRPERNPDAWTPDPDMKKLREWTGDDAKLYEEFACQKISANQR